MTPMKACAMINASDCKISNVNIVQEMDWRRFGAKTFLEAMKKLFDA